MRGVRDALSVAPKFASADVVLVPYSQNGLWGSQRAKLAQLAIVLKGIRSPVVVVLHDVYGPGGRRRSEWWAMAMCSALPRAIIIHGEHERPRLYRMPRADRARVIPTSSSSAARSRARRRAAHSASMTGPSSSASSGGSTHASDMRSPSGSWRRWTRSSSSGSLGLLRREARPMVEAEGARRRARSCQSLDGHRLRRRRRARAPHGRTGRRNLPSPRRLGVGLDVDP